MTQTSALQVMLDSQDMFQKRMGSDPSKMNTEEVAAYIKEHGYFLMEEVVEMFREMPFHKSWKDYSHMTPNEEIEAFKLMQQEAIDAFHFMLNILLALGLTDEGDILEMYKEKNKLNYQRQEDASLGYVSGEKEVSQ